ncbi:hypothetical protein EG329_003814 [Mollisiaceae sp. DMI_Dod_QoI]|nr:hypothetical protein EG329_003814 [Helotiales sp. DMI_Dod_QoI]
MSAERDANAMDPVAPQRPPRPVWTGDSSTFDRRLEARKYWGLQHYCKVKTKITCWRLEDTERENKDEELS